jgi:excisionase family DNA binding protein
MSEGLLEKAIFQAVLAGVAPLQDALEQLRRELQQLRESKPPPVDPDQRLSLAEAATLSGKHRDSLRRAIRQKKLRATKADGGRDWIVRREDLNDYLAGGHRQPVQVVDERRKIEDAVSRVRRRAG